MGKGDRRRRAERRRARAALASDPFALAPIAPRFADGRKERPAERPAEALQSAIDARLRQIGSGDSQTTKKALTAPHIGSSVGLAICHFTGHSLNDRLSGDALDMWTTWVDYTNCAKRYRSLVLQGQGDVAASSITMVSEPIGIEAALSIDIRTPEEKEMAISLAWDNWAKWLKQLRPNQAAILRRLSLVEEGIWQDGAPTRYGLRACEAIRDLTAVVGLR